MQGKINLTNGFFPQHDLAPNASQLDLNLFAWQQFIALNWEAAAQTGQPNTRATPNTAVPFAASGSPDFYKKNQNGLLVWETYAHKSELFPATGAPGAFDEAPRYIYGGGVTIPTKSEPSYLLFNNLDEASEIEQNYLFFPNPPQVVPVGGAFDPLSSVQVMFEAKTNRAEFDYVKGNQFYVPATVKTAAANTLSYLQGDGSSPPKKPFVSMPAGTIGGTEGAIEVKAGFRRLTSEQAASGRYHMANVLFYTGSDTAPVVNRDVWGLVALHIIQKTQNYPYFIFTTFEQVDNLTTPDGKPTGVFYIADYDQVTYQGTPPPTPPFPPGNTKLPVGKNVPENLSGPVPVIQYSATEAITPIVNRLVQTLIRTQNPQSVFQHYKLTGVQAVPSNADGIQNVPPYHFLANSVVESSLPGLQLFQGTLVTQTFPTQFTLDHYANNITLLKPQHPIDDPKAPGKPQNPLTVNMGGCMGCHAAPQQGGYDFSFILRKGPVTNVDVIGLQTVDQTRARTARAYKPH